MYTFLYVYPTIEENQPAASMSDWLPRRCGSITSICLQHEMRQRPHGMQLFTPLKTSMTLENHHFQ